MIHYLILKFNFHQQEYQFLGLTHQHKLIGYNFVIIL